MRTVDKNETKVGILTLATSTQIGAPRDGEFRPLPLSAFQSFAADDEWRDECNAPCQAKHVCHVRTTMDDGGTNLLLLLIFSYLRH